MPTLGASLVIIIVVVLVYHFLIAKR